MAKLIGYTCEKCGGVLNVDSDQEIFDCPFCGAGFDLIDFHRKDILSQAEMCLKRMEYNSAGDKYKELYTKDPHDFEALRGLILCAGKIPVKDDLADPVKLIRHDISKAENALIKLESGCSVYPYFEKLRTVFKLSKEYKKLINEKATSDRSLKLRVEGLKEQQYIDKDKAFRKITADNLAKADSLAKKIKELEQKLSLACEELKSSEPEANFHEGPALQFKNEELEPQIVSDTGIICIKCAGRLVLDKQRNLCECRSCGVAYGASLFFGEPNKRAKEALVRLEFNEADQRYGYMLMLDPSNFEALRGRILCSLKSTRVISHAGLSNFTVKSLKARAEQAVEKALDADKPYFVKYLELADLYSLILAKDNKLKILTRQRDDCVFKREHIVRDFDPNTENCPPDYARRSISETIEDLENEIGKLKSAKQVLVKQAEQICSDISTADNKWIARKAAENK
jgi:hypothetical protein